MTALVRTSGKEEDRSIRKFGPKAKDHPSIDEKCPACNKPFKSGDFTTLIAIGPGDDEEAREKCQNNKAYNAVAIEIHWDCAGGYK